MTGRGAPLRLITTPKALEPERNNAGSRARSENWRKRRENREGCNMSISELGKPRGITAAATVEWGGAEKVSKRTARGILPSTTKTSPSPPLFRLVIARVPRRTPARERRGCRPGHPQRGSPNPPGSPVVRISHILRHHTALRTTRSTALGIPTIQLTHPLSCVSRFKALSGFTSGYPRAETSQNRSQKLPPSRLGDGGSSAVIRSLSLGITCR